MSVEKEDFATGCITLNSTILPCEDFSASGEAVGVVSSGESNDKEKNEVVVTMTSVSDESADTLSIDVFEIRSWFQSLSEADRASYIGFVDPTFVEALRLSVLPMKIGDSGEMICNEGHAVFDWESRVQIDVFEQLYDSLSASSSAESVGKVQPDFEGAASNDDIETNSPLDSRRNNEANSRSRIDVDELSMQKVSDLSLNTIRDKYTTNCDRSERICSPVASAFQKCFLIFPNSFAHVAKHAINDLYPFVTAFFEPVADIGDGFHALAGLDKISIDSFGSRFLDIEPPKTTTNRKAWLRRFDQTLSRHSVPIYSILFARFEYEALQSFNVLHLDQSTRQHVRAVNCGTGENSQDNLIRGQLIDDVLCYSRMVNDQTLSLDDNAFRRGMEPFLLSLGLLDCGSTTLNASDLVCTPLILLLNVGSTNRLGWHAINESVKQSLQRMIQNVSDSMIESVSECDIDETNAANEDVVTDTRECPSVEESKGSNVLVDDVQKPSQSKTQKKKKKKSKKKKNRKSGSTPKENQLTKESPLQKDVASLEQEEDTESLPPFDDLREENVIDEVLFTSVSLPKSVSFDSAESKLSEKSSTTIMVPAMVDDEKDKPDYITISRFDGSIIVSGSTQKLQPLNDETSYEQPPTFEKNTVVEIDDSDDWETVEVRNKVNKKKGTERSSFSNAKYNQQSSSNTNILGNNGKKQKYSRQSTSKRKGNVNSDRKLTKDTLNIVVESIDDEIRKNSTIPPQVLQQTSGAQGPVQSSRPVGNPWKNGPPGKVAPATTKQQPPKPVEPPMKEKTLRDVVLGTHRTAPKQHLSPTKASASTDKIKAPMTGGAISTTSKRQEQISPSKIEQLGRLKANRTSLSVDQNTAPTYQETVSAVSTNSVVIPKAHIEVHRVVKSDSSSGDTDDAPQNKGRQPAVDTSKDGPATPPLPILLSPENANSSTSSVASSLEAPHVVYTPHHSKSAPRTNDVGYHLLDVCNRLSRDMDIFMSRRAIALEPRRQERGALLSALQDSVSSIWPNRCHAELYGSCAIQLDLPSSDLDVVVVGLDRAEPNIPHDDNHTSSRLKPSPLNHYVHMPDMLNGERVLLLAEKLETQAWAVQVKAIPTASVPVVKILADPSRLVGSFGVKEWAPQDHDNSSHNDKKSKDNPEDNSLVSSIYGSAIPFLPWRGLDVVKGLLSLDITFEGYGHGGIGSTVFASRIVDEACLRSGLQPDSAPFVQVLMVLKELLAQRNLNEPYSGGLSSYALLLLLLALARERDAIKDEIDRVEKQKRAMTAADAASFCIPPNLSVPGGDGSITPLRTANSKPRQSPATDGSSNITYQMPSPTIMGNRNSQKSASEKNMASKPSKAESLNLLNSKKPASSWATIAKKATGSKLVSSTGDSTSHHTNHAQNATKAPTIPTFADAVAKSTATNGQSGQTTSIEINKKTPTESKIENRKRSNTVSAIQSTTDIASTCDAKHSEMNHGKNVIKQDQTIHTSGNVTAESSTIALPPYPQEVNDIIEVLCTGETTAGKLLMHFLLFYGQYFDAHTTAIDISGKHPRDSKQNMSPFLQRRAPGSIDPYTGMLIVDPIVVFDPLEGAEQNNVARRCFAWNSVRRLFLQSYETLSSAVERSATPPLSPSSKHTQPGNRPVGTSESGNPDPCAMPSNDVDISGDPWDTKSPLLSCLLSF